MALDVSKIPNNSKFDPVREAILDLQAEISSGVAGVSSLNNQTGAVTIAQGSNVSITTNNGVITISSTASGGGTLDGELTLAAGDGISLSSPSVFDGSTDLTVTITNTEIPNDGVLTFSAGAGLTIAGGPTWTEIVDNWSIETDVWGASVGATFSADQVDNANINIQHGNTSDVTNVVNVGGNVLQSMGFDEFGHVQSTASRNLDERYLIWRNIFTTNDNRTATAQVYNDTLTFKGAGSIAVTKSPTTDEIRFGLAVSDIRFEDGKRVARGFLYWQSNTVPDGGDVPQNSTFSFDSYLVTINDANWSEIPPTTGYSLTTYYITRYTSIDDGAGTTAARPVTYSTPEDSTGFEGPVTFNSLAEELGANGFTIIDGGRVKTGRIQSIGLNTSDLDQGLSVYTNQGSFFDLGSGDLVTMDFSVISGVGNFKGSLKVGQGVGNVPSEINSDGTIDLADGVIVVDASGNVTISNDADIAELDTLTTTVNGINSQVNLNSSNISTNSSNITIANGNISTNASNISTLQSDLNTAEGEIAANASNISTNSTNITANANSISVNSSNISALSSRLTTAEGSISTNASNIQTNTTNITSNGNDISTNASAISQLQVDLNSAESNISANASNISTNTANITSNANGISSNASSISSLQSSLNTTNNNVSANASNIQTNTTNITANSNGIASNTSDISVNASNISSLQVSLNNTNNNVSANASNIQTNTANISSNSSGISANASSISSLTATVNNNTSSITTNANAIAEANGYTEANYALTANANGVITGIQLKAANSSSPTGQVSDITMKTNTFNIVDQNDNVKLNLNNSGDLTVVGDLFAANVEITQSKLTLTAENFYSTVGAIEFQNENGNVAADMKVTSYGKNEVTLASYLFGTFKGNQLIIGEDRFFVGDANNAFIRSETVSFLDYMIFNSNYYQLRGLIGTTSSPANLFMDINNNNQLSRSTSSRKYKTDIVDYDKGIDKIKELRPVYYKGKDDGDKIFSGLIAEEVHEAGLEEFVMYDSDGEPDALAYQNMVSLLIKGMQEQQEQIDLLKSEIENLKNKG
jgi:uncharacterized protein (DUF3084 family)